MPTMKNVVADARKNGNAGTMAQFIPVKKGTNPYEVVNCTADDDIVEGITLIDGRWNGEHVTICKQPGSTVLVKAGAGGWSAGDLLGLDSANLDSLIPYNSANNDIIVGEAEEATAEGKLGSVTLKLQNKTA